MTIHIRRPEVFVLGTSAGNPLPPHAKAGGLHLPAHQADYLRFRQSELLLDSLKWRAVFPGHFNDAVYLLWCHNGR